MLMLVGVDTSSPSAMLTTRFISRMKITTTMSLQKKGFTMLTHVRRIKDVKVIRLAKVMLTQQFKIKSLQLTVTGFMKRLMTAMMSSLLVKLYCRSKIPNMSILMNS